MIKKSYVITQQMDCPALVVGTARLDRARTDHCRGISRIVSAIDHDGAADLPGAIRSKSSTVLNIATFRAEKNSSAFVDHCACANRSAIIDRQSINIAAGCNIYDLSKIG